MISWLALFSSPVRRRAIIAATITIIVVAAINMIRWDAVRDDDLREKAARDASRIEALERARERRDELDTLGDDDLLDRLNRRVHPGPR
ncbi:MAG: hypothetical protein AAFQ38_12890 [Pseudomonadota bacterium]